MSIEQTQISANISVETKKMLEKYSQAQGLKKGFLMEQALLHHLNALRELPADIILPPCIVIAKSSGKRVLERLMSEELPTVAMKDLFASD